MRRDAQMISTIVEREKETITLMIHSRARRYSWLDCHTPARGSFLSFPASISSLYSKRNQTVLALHKPAPKSLQGRHRGWADSQQIDRQHSILLSLLSSRQLLYSLLLRQSVRVRLIFIRAMINVNTVLFQLLRLSKRRMGKREREF